MALEGDRLAVATRNDDFVYVFNRQGTDWVQEAKLQAVGGGTIWRLELSGDTLVAGMPSDGASSNTGSVTIFRRTAGVWSLEANLTSPPSIPSYLFGMGLDVEGDRLAVGSPHFGIGHVVIYHHQGGAWTQSATLISMGVIDDMGTLAPMAYFGTGVSLLGDTLVAGETSGPFQRALEFELFTDLGEPCALDAECWSGQCVDGVCCDAECAGACEACDLAGVPGTCTPVAAGEAGVPSCAPYVCAGLSDCPTSCVDDGGCESTAYCESGACLAKGSLGSACGAANQCQSGFCSDGVCCDSACGAGATDDCEACSALRGGTVDGTCTPLGAGTICRAANGECDAAELCDGSSAMCPEDEPASDGTPCDAGMGSCDDGTCSPNPGAGGGGAGGASD